MTLDVLPGSLAVCRLPPDAPVPAWAWAPEAEVASVTRTHKELSVVCAEAAFPPGTVVESGWRALHVRGPLDFGLVGVVAGLAGPLAAAGIPIFLLSTYDTDVLLVAGERLAQAVGVLRGAGHQVVGP